MAVKRRTFFSVQFLLHSSQRQQRMEFAIYYIISKFASYYIDPVYRKHTSEQQPFDSL